MFLADVEAIIDLIDQARIHLPGCQLDRQLQQSLEPGLVYTPMVSALVSPTRQVNSNIEHSFVMIEYFFMLESWWGAVLILVV